MEGLFTPEALHLFSSPLKGGNENLVIDVCKIHSQEILRFFLERNAEKLKANSEGLMEYLRDHIAHIDSFDLAWDLCFGGIHRQLNTPGIDPLWPAVAVALHLAASEMKGNWSATFAEPFQFRWKQYLL